MKQTGTLAWTCAAGAQLGFFLRVCCKWLQAPATDCFVRPGSDFELADAMFLQRSRQHFFVCAPVPGRAVPSPIM